VPEPKNQSPSAAKSLGFFVWIGARQHSDFSYGRTPRGRLKEENAGQFEARR
jgi:hypothetical protein